MEDKYWESAIESNSPEARTMLNEYLLSIILEGYGSNKPFIEGFLRIFIDAY